MKNTKYLFDESKTPEGMVSVSQLQSFLSCKKKWAYGYIEEITPRVDRAYLTIGKLCHVGMQTAMEELWELGDYTEGHEEEALRRIHDSAVKAIDKAWREYMESVPLLDEEVPDMEAMKQDALMVFGQALEEFNPLKYEVISVVKDGKEIPALELHFRVPCPPTKGLHGYIDAILRDKETGFVWCTDYKFRKTLSPDDEEAYNIQNAVYSYACAKMGIDITGTMTWQHVNTPASVPTLLKNGQLSRAKIKTTWNMFKSTCIVYGLNPDDYEEEMTEKLSDIEWFRATLEYRNEETIKRIWEQCVRPAARSVRSARGKKADNFRSLYPWNCKMCQFQSLCQAELRGYDADAIRLREYTVREHRK